MPAQRQTEFTQLSHDLLKAFDDVSGVHPGFRPTHAKGILVTGVFTPSTEARALTRAPHANAPSTPVTVRFSNFGGIPAIPDNDPNAAPRGMAVRFHLGEHVHTDIVAHSVDGFPAKTAEDFLGFLQAAGASGPDAPEPKPILVFLGSHPAALAFVQTPKPLPSSFARENYFAVTAYKFIDASGTAQFGRYRIVPEGGTDFLTPEAAAAESPNFLFDELRERLARGPAKMRVMVQLASELDVVDDATVHWPEERHEIPFGTIELTEVASNDEAEQRHIIFDPIPRVDGIESSGDPLLDPRADLYLLSGRRRRTAGASAEAGA